MSRIATTRRDVAIKHAWRMYAPAASVLLACLVVLLPVVSTSLIVPDFAFLVLIAWRLLRPEIWTPKAALAFGLFEDLVAGHPLGQSMALWTIIFLAFEFLDAKLNFRDYWMDWFFAALAIIFHTFGAWYVARLMGNSADFAVMLPQLALSILGYPLVARVVLAIDRWRLSR